MSDDADDFEETFEPWTSDGAARLAEAAVAFQAAVAAHAAAVAAADGDYQAVFRANQDLLPVLLTYADAQFEFTGCAFPLDVLAEIADEDDEDDPEDGEEWPTTGISVLQRHDYVVADEEQVLAAGRQAYLKVWPDDDEAAAAADVTYIGRALYQVAHAGGWNSLDETPGLDAVGGFIGVVKQEEVLGPDVTDWADEVLDENADLLYSQVDYYRAP